MKNAAETVGDSEEHAARSGSWESRRRSSRPGEHTSRRAIDRNGEESEAGRDFVEVAGIVETGSGVAGDVHLQVFRPEE